MATQSKIHGSGLMTSSLKRLSQKYWLRKNILKDEELIRRHTNYLITLREERDEIERFLDIISHFTLGDEIRFELGKEEFKLALIESALEKIEEYLKDIDEHLILLILQAMLFGKNFEFLESLGFKVEPKSP
ncbi:MAG: hypothetical protein ACFFCS_04415 [Candidatus Hodarchaeota archaeon]